MVILPFSNREEIKLRDSVAKSIFEREHEHGGILFGRSFNAIVSFGISIGISGESANFNPIRTAVFHSDELKQIHQA